MARRRRSGAATPPTSSAIKEELAWTDQHIKEGLEGIAAMVEEGIVFAETLSEGDNVHRLAEVLSRAGQSLADIRTEIMVKRKR